MSQPPPARLRLRDLGIGIGRLETGPTNSLLDVPHVGVGHATVWRDEPSPPAGRGVARTGVTAVVPFDPASLWAERIPAGVAVLNGAGELTGSLSITEWGVLETPVFLTSTMAVGRVYDGAVAALLAEPSISDDEALIAVVGECDDGTLNHSRIVQVESEDVFAALTDARAVGRAVAEGVVGAGTGMVCFELKGGIGSSSRIVAGEFVVGVMVLANFGLLDRLTIDGVAVGRELITSGWATANIAERRRQEQGSCLALVATDAPLAPDQLTRLARRAGLGLARTGSIGGHYSGEIFLAFSTGMRIPRRSAPTMLTLPRVAEDHLGPLFEAAVDATEEAVLNCLCAADTVTGTGGHTVPGLPLDLVTATMQRYR